MIYFIRKYWKYIFIFVCVTIVFVGTYVYYENNSVSTSSAKKLTVTKNKDDENTSKTVFVDIKGAVNAPGVYELEEGKRIIDVINLAGGLSDNANTINLNLSKKLTDEMYVVVYTKNEIAEYKKNNGNTNEIICASNECVCPDTNNDACISQGGSKNSTSNNASDGIDGKVSINTAGLDELMKLSGIGESKANAIISYRQENGSFKTIEEIKNVSGIGDAVFEKIKDDITI